jgi:uncharacterized protein
MVAMTEMADALGAAGAALGTPMAWVLGAAVGLIMALSGAGGGVLAVPLLIFGLHLSIHQAAPVALVAVGVAAFIGAAMGHREGILRYRAASVMGIVGLAMAPVGVWLAHQLPARPLMIGFAMVLLWTAWRMAGFAQPQPGAVRPLPPCVINPRQGRLRWTAPCALALAATGAVAGTLSGLLGVGGGFVIVPALMRFSDLDPRSIATTSLAVIAIVTVSGVIAATHYGSVDLAIAWPFGLATTLALLAGRRLAQVLPVWVMQRTFAGLSAAVALLLVARAAGWLAQ